MKPRPILLTALTASMLWGAYSYYYTDALTSINTAQWYQNGSVAATPSGLTATGTNGGSLISKTSVNGEIKTTLTLTGSGGTYVQYLRASSDALSGPSASGSFYAVEL
jgi:hypothetical protein